MSVVYFRFLDGRNPSSDDFVSYKSCYAVRSLVLEELNLWSTYKVQIGALQSIIDLKLDIKDDDYILCPLFGDDDKFTDFQFGITETRKENENMYDCFRRGIAEELGLKYTKNILPDKFKNVYFYRHNYRIYYLNINDNLIPNPDQEGIEKNNIPDNKRLPKTGCVIYGNEDDILNFMNRKEIFLTRNDDKIVGIVAVQLKEAKNHFNI